MTRPGDPDWTDNAQLLVWFRDIITRAVRQPLSTPEIRFHFLELGIHGRYLNRNETGGNPKILIATSRRASGQNAVWDTLVPEVAHHAVFELCRADSSGHGIVFCNVANTMAERLGFKGKIQPESRRASYWSGCLR